ncbi:MAG TPA: DUF2953 domain-containing protein [Methanotrichaceae archaeon]|nr:DUF2953 domain-containing protein [Methanotrichaceae archaeon]
MSLLLIILLVIVLLAACILLIPLHISFELLKDGPSMRGFYRIQWIGLTLIQNEFPGKGAKGESEAKEEVKSMGESEAKEEEDAGSDHESDLPKMLSKKNMGLIKDSLPSIASTITDLIRCISVKRLDCSLALGMSDPVETAILSGYIWSALAALGGFWRPGIQLVPDFSGQRLDGSIMTEFRVRLLNVAAASIRALNKEPLRKLIESLVRDSLVAKPQS